MRQQILKTIGISDPNLHVQIYRQGGNVQAFSYFDKIIQSVFVICTDHADEAHNNGWWNDTKKYWNLYKSNPEKYLIIDDNTSSTTII